MTAYGCADDRQNNPAAARNVAGPEHSLQVRAAGRLVHHERDVLTVSPHYRRNQPGQVEVQQTVHARPGLGQLPVDVLKPLPGAGLGMVTQTGVAVVGEDHGEFITVDGDRDMLLRTSVAQSRGQLRGDVDVPIAAAGPVAVFPGGVT